MPMMQFVILEMPCKEQSPQLSTLHVAVSIFKGLSRKFPWDYWNYSCAASRHITPVGGVSLSCLRIRIRVMSIPKHWTNMDCEILIQNKRPEGIPRWLMKNKLWSFLSKPSKQLIMQSEPERTSAPWESNHSNSKAVMACNEIQGSSTWWFQPGIQNIWLGNESHPAQPKSWKVTPRVTNSEGAAPWSCAGLKVGSKAGLQQHQIPDLDLDYLDQRAVFLWISQSLHQRNSL